MYQGPYTDETGRICSRCQRYKLWKEFSKGNGINGRKTACKACMKEAEARYKRDPAKNKAATQRYLAKKKQAKGGPTRVRTIEEEDSTS